jgi:hypothetical protein
METARRQIQCEFLFTTGIAAAINVRTFSIYISQIGHKDNKLYFVLNNLAAAIIIEISKEL